jgi:hypothetical protein
MSKVLILDEETGEYVTPKQLMVRRIRKTLKDPSKDLITLKDVYELLIKILEVLGSEG